MYKPTEIVCNLSENHESIRWFKNGIEVFSMRNRYDIITENRKTTFKIFKMMPHDTGTYYVLINNATKSSEFNVDLKAPPKLFSEQLKDNVTMNAGKNFDFTINFSGYPTPWIDLVHNDLPLKLRGSVQIYDDVVSVRIPKLSVRDSGILKVFAKNEHGEVTHEIKLIVNDVPSAPENLTADNVTHNSAIIRWLEPQQNNGLEVTEYLIEKKTVEVSRWRKVSCQ